MAHLNTYAVVHIPTHSNKGPSYNKQRGTGWLKVPSGACVQNQWELLPTTKRALMCVTSPNTPYVNHHN